jgi:hypothetical protein
VVYPLVKEAMAVVDALMRAIAFRKGPQ